MILDLLLVAAIVFYFARGWHKGFLSTLVQVVGYVLALCGAYIGSRALAETTYQLFIREKLVQSVSDALQNSAASADITATIGAVLEAVPKMLQGFVTSFFGGVDGLAKEFGSTLSGAAESVSATIADQMLYPIIYTLLQALFFLLLFFAIMVIVRSLSKVFRGVRHIPLIGSINSLLGGILGLVQAAVIVLIIVMALNLLIGVTGDGIPYLNNEAIGETYLFRYVYDWNPIGGVSASLGDLGLSSLHLPSIELLG